MRLILAALVLLLSAEAFAQETADALAARVVALAGNPYTVPAIKFTFVVIESGKETARRAHVWCPDSHLVQVDAGAGPVLVDVAHVTDTTRQAHAWFINDGYWLFAPSKLLDGGVRRAMVGGQLQLTFDNVGLTARDRYLLHVDKDGRIDRWSFTLQGGRAGTYQWLDYRNVGPLNLSTVRRNSVGREIRFEGLSVLSQCPLSEQI